MLKSDFTKAAVIAGVIVGLATIVLVGWPLLAYFELTTDAETGERHTHFIWLLNSGPMGRVLAREYAGKTFQRVPWYGVAFVMRDESLWIGTKTEKLRSSLGPPDAQAEQLDRWYLWRKSLLWRLAASEDPPTWFEEHVRWNTCLRADYDSKGRLTAFAHDNWPAVPGDVVKWDAGWSFECNHTRETLPPPPPGWLAAEASNPHLKKAPGATKRSAREQ